MRRELRLKSIAAAVGTVAVVALLGAPSASADSHNWHRTLSDFQLGPSNLAVNQQGVYVADGFLGMLTKAGSPAPVAEAPGLDGIDFSADGRSYAYAWSVEDHSATGLTIRTKGKPDVVADLAAYEASHNPDGGVTYGIIANSNPCAEAILGGLAGGPATYTGITDSHPYSVAWTSGGWYVADAGMNAVLKVDAKGNVSTVAVMPRQVVTFTQEMADGVAEEMQLPPGTLDCVVGVTYAFEPVPTDVEVDQFGALFVSLLPGGPESPALGARGKVYKVNGATGAMSLVASGLLGATNVAVAPDGTLFVTELFANQVSKLKNGKRAVAVHVDRPVSVEVHGGYLYVGQILDFASGAPGSVQRFKI
ncbi:ScyD/ScyE family protein [Monashia sp. NPDC004114]